MKRQIEKLDKTLRGDVAAVIDALAENPRPVGCKPLKGKLAGLFRVVVRGDYRVLYAIDDEARIVHIDSVRARGGAY